ncbi:AAA family ATPase [Streptomyces sp. NPDC018352]|uniref:helix-turn-helix transcriptional regulator n=1 Tax=Streptomyces sp. NPDC018352 TaxID=3157194 RepID=UPI0033E9E480
MADRTRLIGREHESRMLDRLVARLDGGHGEAVVVRGEPGIGKTALLEAVRSAPGPRVLEASGVEFETDFAFAALHQLCVPMLSGIDRLPQPQSAALEAAFGLSVGGVPDPFRVGLAALSLLSETATKRPLLCVVDDAQWLDRASAQALAFAARRLRDEPVAFVFAMREESDRRELSGLRELPLSGLTAADARRLLATRVRAPLDGPVRDRIIAEARGNPLALLELPRTADLAGGFALPDTTTAADRVEAGFRARMRELPADTRMLVLAAAAEPTGNPLLLWRAAQALGIDIRATAPAEDAELLTIGTWVRFRHPLVRSGIYRSASAADRRAVHGALARATDDRTDPDRRAWHDALAATGPDEDLAGALERTAERARARGGIAAAAAFLAEAARLTPDPGLRADRALAAANAKRDVGAVDVASDLAAAAEAGPHDAARQVAAETLRARIAFDTRRNRAAVAKLLRAAQHTAGLDPASAREMFLETLAAAVFVGRFADRPRALDVAAAARALPPAPEPARPLDMLLDGLSIQVEKGFPAAAPQLRRAVDAYVRGETDEHGTGELWIACSAAMDLWDGPSWQVLAERQVRLSRLGGALPVLPVALSYRALAHIHTGEFDDASALVDEAYAIAAEVGVPGLVYVDVTLAAWRGDEQRTLHLAEFALPDAVEHCEGRLVTALEFARAVLYNGLGRYEAAMEAIRLPADLDEMGFLTCIPTEFVEAAARAGRADLAAPVLERLAEVTRAAGTDWALGTERCARALLTDGPAADDLYREAIIRLDRTDAGVHAARARLVYGEWLRRQGYRVEARTHLQAAHQALTSIGAHAFAARAAGELAATGEHVRKRTGDTPTRLTAQEFQIAKLVATGATSKEIGSQLFLSPRTIDAHLRNIFRKLGITSRRQLRDRRFSV